MNRRNDWDESPSELAGDMWSDHSFRLTRRGLIAATAGAVLAGRSISVAKAAEEREKIVTRLLRGMSMERRVAQMFTFQASGTEMTDLYKDLLKEVRPGGIILMGPNVSKPDVTRKFVRDIHNTNRLMPPLISIDQEGGDVIRLPDDPVPGAMELGRLSTKEVTAKAKQRSRLIADYGIDINFAPVADVAYESNSSMRLRSFGSDPDEVAKKVAAMVTGGRSAKVMSAAKHFPGHGRATVDSHHAIPQVDISYEKWLKTDAVPFQAAIDAGVEMVMLGHLHFTKWDDRPTSLSKVTIDHLREDLSFKGGVVITDDLAMGALGQMNPFEVVDDSIKAGVDILLYTAAPATWSDLIDHVVKRVRDGKVSKKRIDTSVRRILRLKVDHFGLEGKGAG